MFTKDKLPHSFVAHGVDTLVSLISFGTTETYFLGYEHEIFSTNFQLSRLSNVPPE